MRKLFITILFIAGIYTICHAQRSTHVDFGLNAGVNQSYIVEGISSPSITGFNAGAYTDILFSDRWSLKVKAIYDQKGWGNGSIVEFATSPDGPTSTETDGVNYRLNYLTVPILANWHFGRTRNWYLHFGPYFGFLLSASESADNTNIKPAFNGTDVGLDLGIGVKFPVSKSVKLFLEADGQGGVSNIFVSSAETSAQNARSSINFGVDFPLH